MSARTRTVKDAMGDGAADFDKSETPEKKGGWSLGILSIFFVIVIVIIMIISYNYGLVNISDHQYVLSEHLVPWFMFIVGLILTGSISIFGISLYGRLSEQNRKIDAGLSSETPVPNSILYASLGIPILVMVLFCASLLAFFKWGSYLAAAVLSLINTVIVVGFGAWYALRSKNYLKETVDPRRMYNTPSTIPTLAIFTASLINLYVTVEMFLSWSRGSQ